MQNKKAITFVIILVNTIIHTIYTCCYFTKGTKHSFILTISLLYNVHYVICRKIIIILIVLIAIWGPMRHNTNAKIKVSLFNDDMILCMYNLYKPKQHQYNACTNINTANYYILRQFFTVTLLSSLQPSKLQAQAQPIPPRINVHNK